MKNSQLDHHHRIEQLKDLINESREAKLESGLLIRELNRLTKDVAKVRKRIPESSNEAEMLQQLTTIAADSEFVVSDYRRGNFQREGVHARFEIGITGHGSYSSICKFVDGINRLSRINRLEKLEIHSDDDSDTYPVSLTISAFYGDAIAKTLM